MTHPPSLKQEFEKAFETHYWSVGVEEHDERKLALWGFIQGMKKAADLIKIYECSHKGRVCQKVILSAIKELEK